MDSTQEQLLCYIEKHQIGYESTFQGPFGNRRVLYADFTASGKPLRFIEEYLQHEVMLTYGNTHTTTSLTSRQTTYYREEARSIIRVSLNCTEEDSLIFVGSGCTGAVAKLVSCLCLDKLEQPAVVFVSPFEHHSNLLPWQETKGTEVVRLSLNEYGEMDSDDLERKLKYYSGSGRLLIGALNAGSNITGVLTDTDTFSSLLHRYGALAFWDYAAAAPYVNIDMNSTSREGAYKDGVYFSVHKFVGGAGTPGVLCAKNHVFRNSVPHIPGGGTVLYVIRSQHSYSDNPEIREEGGTPEILGSIRAGLAVQLKESVGSEVIMSREERLTRLAFREWADVRELVVVGPDKSVSRLPIFSFLVRHPQSGLFLHHNFVCALLNDLFGIQARGGCACAGPYGQALLDIGDEEALKYVMESGDCSSCSVSKASERELVKPGFSRLNFPFFMSHDSVDYIIKAVVMVAREGWKLLPLYTLNPETGQFLHKDSQNSNRKLLNDISYDSGKIAYPKTTQLPTPGFNEALREARILFDQRVLHTDSFDHIPALSKEAEEIRWFLMPQEAQQYLLGRDTPLTTRSFSPKVYATKPGTDHLNELDDQVHDLPDITSVLERRSTFRSLVRRESVKEHPLEKKSKKRRKKWFFPLRKTRQRISSERVEERRSCSGNQNARMKSWISAEVLTDSAPQREKRGGTIRRALQRVFHKH